MQAAGVFVTNLIEFDVVVDPLESPSYGFPLFFRVPW